MKNLTNQLRDICSSHILEEKILIVPSNSVGRQILQAITKDDVCFINLKAITLNELAYELCKNRFYEKNTEYLENVVSLQFIMNKVEELLSGEKLHYFDKMQVNSKICSTILSSIMEIRMAGINSYDLDEDSFVSKSKGQDIKKILAGYEEILKENNYFDNAMLYKSSLEILNKNTTECLEKLYYVVPNLELQFLEMSFLEKLTKGHCAELQLTKDVNGGKNFSLSKAYGESNEVHHIFKSIKNMGVPLDDMAVFYTDTNTYTQLLYDVSIGYEIPITFGDGINIKNSTSGRLFFKLTNWVRQGFFASCLYDIFLSGDFKIEDENITIGYLAKLLKNVGIGWGRNRYLISIDNEIEKNKQKITNCEVGYKDYYEKKQLNLQLLRNLIKTILAYIPEEDEEGTINFKNLTNGIASIIYEYSKNKNEIDLEAKKTIIDILKLCGTNCEPLINQNDAIEFLEDSISGLRVHVSNPKSGHIHICSYTGGVYVHRKTNFLMGMDAGKFPGSGLEDPIVLDAERKKLSPYLPLREEEINNKSEKMNRLLSSISGDIFVSYSCFDTTSNRTQYPSFIMLKLYRLLENNNSLDYSSLSNSFINRVSFATANPEESLDEAQWWLSSAIKNNSKIKVSSISEFYSGLTKGINAMTNRESEKFTEFDGKLNEYSGEFNPKNNENMIMSTSQLETLGKCPYGYFLKYILNIKVPDEVGYDASIWLDPATRGSLLHSVFEKFYKKLKDKNEKPCLDKHELLLNSIAEELLDNYKKEVVPVSEIVYEQEKNEILQSCRFFLVSEEEKNDKAEPCYFELSFGKEDKNDEIGVIDKAQILLKDDSKIYLRGIIDRVDKVSEGKYRIIDYKTGSSYNYDSVDVFKGGRQLQHALYSVALEQILRDQGICDFPEVIEAGYIFPTLKGKGQRYMRNQQNRVEFYNILNNVLMHLEKASFHMTNDMGDCTYCDFKDICERVNLEGFIDLKINDIEGNIYGKGCEIDG
jgi:ATP-dependent helicase/nuclease subunit B